MAEKIKITNSYFKEMYISKTNDYGVESQVDLKKYDDCYVVFKKDRNTLDEDSFLIKKISPDLNKPGVIPIYLSPEETMVLPLTDVNLPYFYMFVNLGSTATGENIEIDYFKVKTEYAGLRHYTRVDTTLDDLGNIKGFVGYTFDCGPVCNAPVFVVDISGGAPLVFDCGIAPAPEYFIVDLGPITSEADTTYNLTEYRGGC
jgi:hypothetical protein